MNDLTRNEAIALILREFTDYTQRQAEQQLDRCIANADGALLRDILQAEFNITPSVPFSKATFIGVYRRPERPNQRIPVREFEGKHYDLMGNPIDLNLYVKVSE